MGNISYKHFSPVKEIYLPYDDREYDTLTPEVYKEDYGIDLYSIFDVIINDDLDPVTYEIHPKENIKLFIINKRDSHDFEKNIAVPVTKIGDGVSGTSPCVFNPDVKSNTLGIEVNTTTGKFISIGYVDNN